MLQALETFFTSSLMMKIIVSLIILSYTVKLRGKKEFWVLKHFRLIVLILLSTDILFHIFPWRSWYLLSNALVVGVYLRILNHFTRKRHLGPVYIIWNILTVGFSFFHDFTSIVPNFLQFFFHIQIMANYIWMGLHYYRISNFNTEKAQIIIHSRLELIRIPLAFHFIALFFGFSNSAIAYFLLPMSYLVHYYALSFYEKAYDRRVHKKARTLENNLDSVFEFMVTIGNAIQEKVEMDKVLDFVVKSALKSTGASGGCILLVDEFDDVLRVKSVEGNYPPLYKVPDSVKTKHANLEQFFRSTPISLGTTVLGESAVSGKGIFIRNTSQDPRMELNTKADLQYISSIIVIPLILDKKVLGVLSVVSQDDNHRFSKSTFDHLKTFGDYTSLTINNLYIYLQLLEKQEMEREVGIAAEIQGQLLPAKLPRVSSVSLAAYSLPAKGVSGDYYDVISLKKGRVLMVMCDVAGKGIPASLVMVMIRTIIHLVAHQKDMSASRIMNIINWGIAGKIALDRFATMSLITYDFAERSVEYCNAAHHPLLIYRANKDCFETMDTEGLPIGLEKKSRYNQINTKLDKNDIIMLYTDGIIEAMNEKGEQYSFEALEEVVRKNRDLSPEKLKKQLVDDVGRFVGKAKQHDDQTFLVMKVEN